MAERPVPRIAPPTDPTRPVQTYAPDDPAAPPAITVVTPVFDRAEHLEGTARSLAAQTFRQFEWVIVDDGSTDPATQASIERAIAIVPASRVVRHERNLGLAAARNTGFAAAAGKLVMQLDGDDLLEPTALDKLHWQLLHHPQAAFSKGHTAGFGAESYLWVNGFDNPDRFLDQNQADSIAMIRRSAHVAAGGYDPDIRDGLEDWEFWLRCAAAGMWGTTVPEVLGWYRRRHRHGARWANWDGSERETAFRDLLRHRYSDLWSQGMPAPPRPADPAAAAAPPTIINRLRPHDRRLLLVVGTPGDALLEDLRVRTVAALRRHGWECVVALLSPSSHRRLAVYLGATPDVFAVPHLVPPEATASTLSYLVDSRAPRVVVVWGDGPEHPCLRYLASRHPECSFATIDAGGAAEPAAPGTVGEPSVPTREVVPPRALPWPALRRSERRRLRRRLGMRGMVATADAPHGPAAAEALARQLDALRSGGRPVSLVVLVRPGEEAVEIPSIRRARHVRVTDLADVARVFAIADGHVTTAGGSGLTAALARAVGVPVVPTVGSAESPSAPEKADVKEPPRLNAILSRLRSRAGDPRASAAGSDDAARSVAAFAETLAASEPSDGVTPPSDSPLRLPLPVAVSYRVLLHLAPGIALAVRDRVRRRRGLPPATIDLDDLGGS